MSGTALFHLEDSNPYIGPVKLNLHVTTHRRVAGLEGGRIFCEESAARTTNSPKQIRKVFAK